jgi:hypothetical protein
VPLVQPLDVLGGQGEQRLLPDAVLPGGPEAVEPLEYVEQQDQLFQMLEGELPIEGVGGVGQGVGQAFAPQVVRS